MAEKRHSVELSLEPLIFVVRGYRVILDADLAQLYGVTTKSLNQAFKRNRHRFPSDFAFQLSAEEFAVLRRAGPGQHLGGEANSGNWSQFVTSSRRHRGARYRPWAFTEHGALLRLREQVTANVVILKRLAEIYKTLLQHDATLREVYRKLQALLAPPPDEPKRRIGF